MSGDRVHKVRFSKSGSPVNEQRIVHPAGRFRDSDRCRVGKLIVRTDDEVLESILWIEPCVEKGHIDLRVRSRNFHPQLSGVLQFFLLCLLRKNESDLVLRPGDLRDRDLKRKQILLGNIVDSHLARGHKDDYGIISDVMNTQRLKPCTERDVRDVKFHLDTLKNLIPCFCAYV